MECNSTRVTHTIQQGDTLYSLAIRYGTTVTQLLEFNPDIDIFNLQIGTELVICPGFVTPKPPIGMLPAVQRVQELVSLIFCWIAENLGENAARLIISNINDSWSDNQNPC